MRLASQCVWGWKLAVNATGPVGNGAPGGKGGYDDKRNRRSIYVALDVGCGAVAFDTNHPVLRELVIAAYLTAAENPAGIPGNGTEGNTRQRRHSRPLTEIRNRDGLASPAPTDVASDVAARPRKNSYCHHCGLQRLVNRSRAQIGTSGGRNGHKRGTGAPYVI